MPINILQLASVRKSFVRSALEAHDVQWDQAIHVCTAATMENILERDNLFAITIATLIDLITSSLLPLEYAVSRSLYPERKLFLTDKKEYTTQKNKWMNALVGRQIRKSVQTNNELRAFARSSNNRHAHTIYKARRTFIKTISELTTDGILPTDIDVTDPLIACAVEAWQTIEANVPGFTVIRDTLWRDPSDFVAQKTAHSQNLMAHFVETIRRISLHNDTDHVFVFHGFFYYHPKHWALIQLLQAIPTVHVYIITHNDGKNPVFAAAERYYSTTMGWPEPTVYEVTEHPTPAARIFLQAINGNRIEAQPDILRILESKTPADFVGHINQARTMVRLDPDGDLEEIPKLYAADAPTINRYFERLDIMNPARRTDLSKLPIGIFLVRLHECIIIDINDRTRSTIELTCDRVSDIIASNFLMVDGSPSGSSLRIWEQVAPFFQDCVSPVSWQERAALLTELNTSVVHHRTPKRPPQDDLQRISRAAQNITRLIPWADISTQHAQRIERIIQEIIRLIGNLTTQEQIRLQDHHTYLTTELTRGMQNVPAEEYREMQDKLNGYGVGLDDTVFVEGLVDIVHMLLARSVDFDGLGDPTEGNDRFRSLRSLEVLGYERTNQPIHLANLADGIFPVATQSSYWPFSMDSLKRAQSSMSVAIMRLRNETTHLGDIYMLWLGLDGVVDAPVTMSWVASVAGELHNRSALIDLFTRPTPTANNARYIEMVGGIPITPQPPRTYLHIPYPAPQPTHVGTSEFDHYSTHNILHRHAVSAAIICNRRLAMQWLFGPTISYHQENLTSILYGNFIGLVEKNEPGLTEQAVESLWQHLIPGEKRSYLAKKRVGVKGADRRWLYTLKGNRTKTNTDSFSRAYQAIVSNEPITSSPIPIGTFLPEGVREYAAILCENCPVVHRCAVAEM